MNIKDLIDVIEKLETRLNSYWNFYTVVILASAGWLFTEDHVFKIKEKIIISFGLVLFFIVNLFVILCLTKRIAAFEDELNAASYDDNVNSSLLKQELSKKHLYTRFYLSIVLHVFLDIFIIFILINL